MDLSEIHPFAYILGVCGSLFALVAIKASYGMSDLADPTNFLQKILLAVVAFAVCTFVANWRLTR